MDNECSHKMAVLDSRVIPEGRRRRYQCVKCGHKHTTMEVVIKNACRGRGNTVYKAFKKDINVEGKLIAIKDMVEEILNE